MGNKKFNIVLLTKGLSIEAGKLTTISYKIKNELKKNGFDDVVVSAIKGPCLAAGLANKMRTGTVIASENKDTAKLIKKISEYSVNLLQKRCKMPFSNIIH